MTNSHVGITWPPNLLKLRMVRSSSGMKVKSFKELERRQKTSLKIFDSLS
jgi:hypothetical protein